ncbi:MAG: hypothetical protein J0I01_13045 [Stenotrophomonas nitritireducens]|uniref:Uncharacterized protein n=1 Tax=Stenotrophomonas nitritireducens TaxID=83617 RepID=A0A9D8KYH2_9GAMM|nr:MULTISPECIES: hypothetical protein [Stenotrophomonas]MBN8769104.1 hypothetical protein [Stenotrophomonas sp.]MBN8793144.1 hypothetical protein [Stenotrophomonas nitritireducens]MBN8798247.1 hypothetical protein [Stenotrophomonas nitritireducens]
MRLRHLPAFLPTRRAPAFSKAEHRPWRDNGLNPLHFAALRETRTPAATTGLLATFPRLAACLGAAFVPPAGEKFP